jgi:hypothetical protein
MILRLLALLIAVCLPVGVRADLSDGSVTSELPPFRAQDARAPVVSEGNLLASERFWPYQVSLSEAWRPAGRAQPLPQAASGVLIRVEASGMARIDFGRDGLHQVPVEKTDLLASANRIRLGELEKQAPNFVLALGPRLLDSRADELRPLPFGAVAGERGYLCVFADPESDDFTALAAALGPLRERRGLATILFPQGAHADARVRERLRASQWTVAFVYDHLSEAYTQTLWPDAIPPAGLLLVTSEGRVLFQSPWRAGAVSQLLAAVERAFPDAPTSAQR